MGGQSVSRTVTVGLENGLHLVPCSRLVKLANGLGCDVRIRKGSVNADGKNIFDLMGLAAAFGDQLELLATGQGADEAIAKLVQLFESNFAD
jgi:phosphotransferase system HPr (HPr) family protein